MTSYLLYFLKDPIAHTPIGASVVWIGLFLIFLGLIIKHFRLYFLIAGYNTLPSEEKEKVNIVKLATLLRNVLVIMGAIMIGSYYTFLHFNSLFVVDYIFFATIGLGVLYILVQGNSAHHRH